MSEKRKRALKIIFSCADSYSDALELARVETLACRRDMIYKAYTAISIYVVGSKLQGYGTRPKGGMGRLELILGFRGCRREMDMEAENTISIALRVLTKSNKNRYDSYCLKAVPLFETVKGLKEYLVQRSVPDDAEEDENSYEHRLSRLRANHKLPKFKLRCWARMLVSNFEFPAFE